MTEQPAGDDQKLDVRFNMFMSQAEFDAIEEWSWANRIRSKSEAVRQLIAAGLEARKMETKP